MESNAQVVSNLSGPHQAYNRRLPEIVAIKVEELETMTVDVGTVYTQASGPLMKAREYQEQVLALPGINKDAITNLDDYWLATGHSQTLFLTATTPVAPVPILYQKLLETREIMAADAKALRLRGLIPADKVEELTGPVSHSNCAFHVQGFAQVFREYWDVIAGKTAMQMSEIEQAETQAHQLVMAVGARSASEADVGAASLNRRRAFTLFARAYEEMRHGVAFLRRHEGDVDEIMPKLHTLRAPSRRKAERDGDESTNDLPAEPPVTPPSNGAPVETFPVGHPDSSPFTS